MKLKMTDSVLIDGNHVEAGAEIDVNEVLGLRLISANKAVRAPEKSEQPAPKFEKQTRAPGLSSDTAGALVRR